MKLIATDLDGTLLRSDDTISERTRSAIRAASERGIHVVLVTARPPRSVRWIAERLDVTGLAICSNGAIAYDLASDTISKRQAAGSARVGASRHPSAPRPRVCLRR